MPSRLQTNGVTNSDDVCLAAYIAYKVQFHRDREVTPAHLKEKRNVRKKRQGKNEERRREERKGEKRAKFEEEK